MASVYDMTPTGYREWFMNSKTLRYGSRNRAVAFLPQNGLDDVMAVTLLEAQIPYTFYTINAGNNTLFFATYTGGVPTVYSITIPPGNYTSTSIVTTINGLAMYPYGSSTPGTNQISVTYNDASGKLQFLTTAAAGLTPTLIFVAVNANSLSNMCEIPLGFDPTKRQNFALSTSVNFTPPYTIQLGGPGYLMVHGSFGLGGTSDLMTNDLGDNSGVGNLIGAIPINCVPGGTISWTNPAPKGGFFNLAINKLTSAEFWVTSGDDDRTTLDFNGAAFQLKLGFLTRNSGNVYIGSTSGEKGVTTSTKY
jgi:hypothetical protein